MATKDVPKTAVVTSIWVMGISSYALWPQKRCSILSTTNGQYLARNVIRVRLPTDDILVAFKNLSEHNSHLRTVFQLLSDNGLVVNRAKCVFGAAELTNTSASHQ